MKNVVIIKVTGGVTGIKAKRIQNIFTVNLKLLNMYTNAIVILAVVAAVSCQGWEGSWDGDAHKDYYAPPHYSYEYKVHDGHTGDVKAQHETREGDVVKGYYTLKEADGTTREVHYSADKHNGFNAEVKRIGHAHHAPAHHGWY